MDSPPPDGAKTTIRASSSAAAAASLGLANSPPVQVSPFSSYASKLSPINPVKAALVAPPGFLGLNSPPLVLNSPQILPPPHTSFLQRSPHRRVSSTDMPEDEDDDGSERLPGSLDSNSIEHSSICLKRKLTAGTHADSDAKTSARDQPNNSSVCVDDYLSDPVDAVVDCENSVNSRDLNVKQSVDVIQSLNSGLITSRAPALQSAGKNDMSATVDASHLFEQPDEHSQGDFTFRIKPSTNEGQQSGVEKPSNECLHFHSVFYADHLPETQLHETLSSQANLLQRGMSRRCLQFDDSQGNNAVNSTPPSYRKNLTCLGSPASITEMETPDSSLVDTTAPSSNKQMVKLSGPMTVILSSHNSGKSPLAVPRPSGIGLHLNSIVNALSVAPSATINVRSMPITSGHLVDNTNGSSEMLNLVEKVPLAAEDKMLDTKTSLAASCDPSEYFHSVETLNMSEPPQSQIIPLNKRSFNSEHDDNFEEFTQSSSKKKRKKLEIIEGDGYKRCKCRKSKCLKLYCDCFAAGIYCAETCGCQGCFNRPEYEDTVLETRQQIESRNPLAFAPKIVQLASESPATDGEDGNQLVPSARHKTGCNCKRSMCLKKYCECYQANVGCSNGCRCEGCKNVYGRKDGFGMTEETVRNGAEERLEMATNKESLHTELSDLLLTPFTPSAQFSDHGKYAPRSQLIARRYVPSPESDFSMPYRSKSETSKMDSQRGDMLQEGSKETLDMVPFGQGLDFNIADMMKGFSSEGREVGDLCDTPAGNPPSMTIASSASSLCRGSGQLSSAGSLYRPNSSFTPVTQFGKNQAGAVGSTSLSYDILEDDTPELLKEASNPKASVKVSSPNKKRVSPPHSHIRRLGSSSSGGLKCGRKFILKAMPSFPPLTPCTDFEGSKDNQKKQQ